jgi:hypothetical protein
MHECHITISKPENVDELDALAARFGWKTSFIHGDPLLGKAGYFYFTTHHVDYDKIFEKMEFLSGYLEGAFNIVPLRKKIEQIVYDTKTALIPKLGLRDANQAYETCEGPCSVCASRE